MDASRLLQWLLAVVVLSLSSSLIVSEVHQLARSDSSAINVRRNETNRIGMTAIRRRRYVRFPTGAAAYLLEGGPPLGRNLGARFTSQTFPASWKQQKALWRSPVIADYTRPVMSHRSPRLIFRDDFSPIGGGAAFFQHSNQLPDFEDDIRDHRKQTPDDYPRLETVYDFRRDSRHGNRYDIIDGTLLPLDSRSSEIVLEQESFTITRYEELVAEEKRMALPQTRQQKRPLWKGDDTLCADGRSCEFFLMCWMTAGLLDGSCGGIMFACCQRKDPNALTDNNLIESPRDQSRPLPLDLYTETASDDARCGIPVSKQIAQRRIVGGDDAGFGSFPWQAYIRIGSSRCGGTLVNRFHVVTAGHCVAKASARQVQVTLGDYMVNSASESLPAYTFGVREIRVHPYFKFTPQADRFDVAVLRLDRPVHYMPHIAPICLPEKNEDFLGQYGWAAGWGALQAGSRLRPKTLQAVDVPVIDNRLCERWHRSNGINVVIYDEMMCAGYRGGGKDSCQGDSGGPLMLEKTGRWYLIGIVSAGYSCAQPGQPGIYHRVAKTVDWITYVINS